MRWSLLCLSLFGPTVTGCFVDDEPPDLGEDFATCSEEEIARQAESIEERAESTPTYWQDAKAILDARCVGCHQVGGIAPFALATYEQALVVRDEMRQAVATDAMPPWQPDDCCSEYRWDRSIPEHEKETLLRWIDQGNQLGDDRSPAPPIEVEESGLSRVDLTLTMPEPFEPTPRIGADEVRCFLLDWPIEETVYVRGIDVVPGQRSMVHHVIVAAVDEDSARRLRKREGQDGRPGWDCLGELGDGIKFTGQLGGWAPGYRGVELPDGLGRKVKAGSTILLNVHYDTGRGTAPDQTSIQLQLADSVEKKAKSIGIINPMWLVGDAMPIAQDDPDASAWFAYDPTDVMTRGKAYDIYGVNLHMHELGRSGRMAILREDGSRDCLVTISRWDFDWLGEYYFKEPVRLYPGDRLYLECHWDNTAANQKIVNGEQVESRDISWGTDEEMCAGVLTGWEVK